jgi:hypothetical protein
VLKVGKVIHYEDDGKSKKMNTSSALPENNPTIYRVKTDVVSFPPLLHLTTALIPSSTTKSKSRNTQTTASFPTSQPPTTTSNSSSACCHPSTASTSPPSRRPQTQASSASPSRPLISTASSTSASITAAPSLPTSMKRGRSPFATLRTTSGRGAGRLAARGCGLEAFGLRLRGGWCLWPSGCTVRRQRGVTRRCSEVQWFQEVEVQGCVDGVEYQICDLRYVYYGFYGPDCGQKLHMSENENYTTM